MQNSKLQAKTLFKLLDPDFASFPAFIDHSQSTILTYQELFYKAAAVSLALKAKPFKQVKILLFLDSGINFVAAFYGILLSGNYPLLLNNKLKEELRHLNGLFSFAVSDHKNLNHLKHFSAISDQTLLNMDEIISSSAVYPEPINFDADTVAAYLFTTGSTGKPKLIEKTFHNLWVEVSFLQQFLQVQPGEVFLSLVPTFHIYGLLFGVILPFYAGAAVRSDIPFSPMSMIEDGILKPDTRYMIGNPTQYGAIHEFLNSQPFQTVSQLKYLISSTMAMDSQLLDIYANRYHLNTLEIYGSTETGGIAYRKYAENQKWFFFPYIRYQAPPPNQVLEIQSPALSLSPDQQSEWFLTGDVVQGDNPFELLGRVNQIIKVGGNRVSALEVEKVILDSGLVNDVAAVGISTQDLRGESLAAYVVPVNSTDPLFLKKLKSYCREKLPDFKIPKYFVSLIAIPRGPNHKVLFKDLPKIKD